VLRRLGEATSASRVYIFENYAGEDGELWATQRYEWVAVGVSAQFDNTLLKALPYKAAGFGRWVEMLGRGDLVHGHVRDLPESEQPELRHEAILSIAIVPVFVEGRWWGFIGFDECLAEREWSAAEISALGAAAGTLGAALRRKQVDNRLRQSEERYRAVVEQATDGIFLLDVDTRNILESNPAFRRMFGYSAEELRGVGIYDLVAHPREDVDAAIRRTLEERSRLIGERKYRRKDGTILDADIGVSVISYGGREAICTIVRDITERKQVEERVRASAAELRAVFGAMHDLVFVLDREGRYLKIAPTETSLLYKPPTELIGKTLHELLPIEQADWFLGHVRRALDSGQRVEFEYDLQINTRQVRFEATVSPMMEGSVVIVARDITERKRAEEEIKESQRALATLMSNLPGMAYRCRNAPDWTMELVSEGSYELTGYPPTDLLSNLSISYGDLIHPEERQTVRRAVQAALEERRPFQVTYRITHASGQTRWVWEQGRGIFSEEGELLAIEGFITDVTERRHAEEALRESEERFRSAFESAAVGMAIVKLDDGRWLEVNRPLCEMLGYSENELLGMTFGDVTYPEDLEADLQQTSRLLSGEIGSFQMEKRYIHSDGHTVWALLSASLVRGADGEPLYGIAQIEDITARKQAEESLARSEGRLRTIVETEPECVKVLGMDGSLLEMNSAGLSMIEADSLDQVRGKTVYEYITPEHRPDFVALTERVLGGSSGTLEFELLGLKGTRRWLETHAVPLRYAQDEIAGLLAVTRDITERKQAEQALKQSEELYRTVIEQATENIFLVDVESRTIVESNAAFQEALGYSEEELHRMKLYDVVAADRESVDENIRRILLQNNPFVGERNYRRKDGSLLQVEVSASLILRNGRQTMCAVAHDITERAQAQRLLEERLSALSSLGVRLALEAPVQDTLDAMTQSIVNASTAVACSVALSDAPDGSLSIEGSYGLPEEFVAGIEAVWRKGVVRSPTMEAVHALRPTLASHKRQRMLESPVYEPVHDSIREVEWDTVFIVPLVSRGRSLGAINFAYLPGQEPGKDERTFLTAVADQAAIAIENSRLLAEARGKAALEERQRLARELHDSVSQALYGIALGTKTARAMLGQEPAQLEEPLDYVLSLTEAGMAEMRALIFELRPESLEEEGLVAALQKQAASLRARHRIEVEADVCEEPEASMEVKEAIYRIAQEALHNTVKHSHASKVRIKMECDPEMVTFETRDNGTGFDTTGDFPGHLGLRSMRERVRGLGGTLQLDTVLGKGTTICVRVPT
jgi:PAS domain S-box-containing protein